MIAVYIIVALSILILPLLTIMFGKMLLKNPPNQSNNVYGYRTKRASLSQESWDYAQKYSGSYLCSLGKVTLIISAIIAIASVVILSLMNVGESSLVLQLVMYIPMGIQIIALLSVVPYTEKELKRKFETYV